MTGTYSKADFHAGAEVFNKAIVPHPPVDPTDAATKQFVDESAEVTVDPAEPMTLRTDLWIDTDEDYPVLPPTTVPEEVIVDAAQPATPTDIWIDTDEDYSGPVTDHVEKTGDTMTGPLILSGNPTVPLEAVTKQYTDISQVGYVHNGAAIGLADGIATQVTFDPAVCTGTGGSAGVTAPIDGWYFIQGGSAFEHNDRLNSVAVTLDNVIANAWYTQVGVMMPTYTLIPVMTTAFIYCIASQVVGLQIRTNGGAGQAAYPTLWAIGPFSGTPPA